MVCSPTGKFPLMSPPYRYCWPQRVRAYPTFKRRAQSCSVHLRIVRYSRRSSPAQLA
jgi:hypothetical protein